MPNLPPAVTTTICAVIIIAAVTLLLKVNGTNPTEILESFKGILTACLTELRLRGGRAPKINIVFSILLTVAAIIMQVTSVLKDLRQFLDPTETNDRTGYFVFGALFVFFFVSLCFVASSDRFERKMRRKAD